MEVGQRDLQKKTWQEAYNTNSLRPRAFTNREGEYVPSTFNYQKQLPQVHCHDLSELTHTREAKYSKSYRQKLCHPDRSRSRGGYPRRVFHARATVNTLTYHALPVVSEDSKRCVAQSIFSRPVTTSKYFHFGGTKTTSKSIFKTGSPQDADGRTCARSTAMPAQGGQPEVACEISVCFWSVSLPKRNA